jgi:hypothetical protein
MQAGSGQSRGRRDAEPQAAGSKRGSREKMLAALWATAKGHAIADTRVYQVCSSMVGRVLVKGFGLTTCTHEELIRCVDAVKREAGEPVSLAKSPRAPRQRIPKDPPNVVRLASVGQLQKAHGLERELKIEMNEAAGIARRACGTPVPRTAKQVGQYTEALKAIKARRTVDRVLDIVDEIRALSDGLKGLQKAAETII